MNSLDRVSLQDRMIRGGKALAVVLLVGLVPLGSPGCSRGAADTRGAVSANNRTEASDTIAVAPVEEQLVDKAIVSSARIVFDENRVSHIFSPVTGRVTQIIAQLGETVHRGQKLAIITSPDMGNAMSDVNKAKPNVIQTEKELARQKELYSVHAGPLRDLESAQSNYAQAVAELQRATEKLRLLMEQAQTDRISQAFPLISPIDGEVVARQINPGTEVQGQYSGGTTTELYTIGLQDSLWVLADTYEQDLSHLKLGAPVDVTTVAYPDKVFSGRVNWISGTLDPSLRTVTVRCTLDNPDHLLKAGMYATVSIHTEGRKALAVPRGAILHFGDKAMVIGVTEHSPRVYTRIPVIVDEAAEVGDFVPVLHGLERGTRIVTAGALLASVQAEH